MGSVGSTDQSCILLNMKFLVLVSSFAAAAYADADADASLYTGFGYGRLAYGYFGKSAPCVNAANQPVPCANGYLGGYVGYPAVAAYGAHLIGKRDADAEPEADADAGLLYTGAYAPFTTTYGAGVVAAPYYRSLYNTAFPYRGFGYRAGYTGLNRYTTGLAGYTGVSHLLGKREAEAEPEADAGLLYTATYAPLTTTYRAGVLGSPYYRSFYNSAFPYRGFGYRAGYGLGLGYTGLY